MDAFWSYFNPRTREGCDVCRSVCHSVWDISIHAPAKGATCFFWRLLQQSKLFQSTHPRRVRHKGIISGDVYRIISIHAPAKGATKYPLSLSSSYRFQSTHPRRVRHAQLRKVGWIDNISIHAPAKGATLEYIAAYVKFLISIHAPAKGATSHSL